MVSYLKEAKRLEEGILIWTLHNEKLRRPFRIAVAMFFVLFCVWLVLILTDGSQTAVKWVWGFEGIALGVEIGLKVADVILMRDEIQDNEL